MGEGSAAWGKLYFSKIFPLILVRVENWPFTPELLRTLSIQFLASFMLHIGIRAVGGRGAGVA